MAETSEDPLKVLFRNHVESYNHFVNHIMPKFPDTLHPVEIDDENVPRMRRKYPFDFDDTVKITDISLGYPTRTWHADKDPLYPSECREARLTYGAPLRIKVQRDVLEGATRVDELDFTCGELPVMTLSDHCHLSGLSPDQLVARHEERREQGGFFIVNGNEKVLRMFVLNRRHYPFAVHRSAFCKRGKNYTPYGIMIRCVMPDETSVTNVLHYLDDGSARLRILLNKQEFFIPLVLLLRALTPVTDREIFNMIVDPGADGTYTGDSLVSERVQKMLTDSHASKIFERDEAVQFIGARFRVAMNMPSSATDLDIGRRVITDHVLVHLPSSRDKFNLLCLMTQKLFALVDGRIVADNMDTSMHHELLLPGPLIAMFVREQLQDWLTAVGRGYATQAAKVHTVDYSSADAFRAIGARHGFDIGHKVAFLLATGNLVSRSGLDLMQVAGLSIIAEKLNYTRYLSHFRGVHRGSFFVDSKDTTVRRLLPESWGFLCPIHTPDGPACGLACHLAQGCHPTLTSDPTATLPDLLASLGMVPAGEHGPAPAASHCPVLLDGRVLGHLAHALLHRVADTIRVLKVRGEAGVPARLEIGVVDPAIPKQQPVLAMWATRSRYCRPVHNLALDAIEWVGSFEQVFLDIAVTPEELTEDTTHLELNPNEMLDVIAAMTPFSDFNQSPRCMYQVVMSKQTMATPVHSFPYRTDNKMYRIQSPQLPIVETDTQGRYDMNEYPHGTNAVVAVISYTGYDMEDAMIINKGSYDRGMFHGTVYVTKDISLDDGRGKGSTKMFANIHPETGERHVAELDVDGLAPVGMALTRGTPMACILDTVTGEFRVQKYKGGEDAIVDTVRIIGHGDNGLQMARFKLRHIRKPTIGDKFSSRHGQKGVLSVLWPQADMPFTEEGITPDCIINPCVVGETPITMHNGMSRPIEALTADEGVFSCDPSTRRIESAVQTGLIPRGEKDVVALTLQDGRVIKATPDHKFLTVQGQETQWVAAGDLTEAHRVVVGMEGALDVVGADEADWSLSLGASRNPMTFTMDAEGRDRALAFARILGYACTDGTVAQNKGCTHSFFTRLYLGSRLDVDAVKADIFTILGDTSVPAHYDDRPESGDLFVLSLPAPIANAIGDAVQVSGRRVSQDYDLPACLDAAPLAFVREFIAGYFGGDGTAPYVCRVNEGQKNVETHALKPPQIEFVASVKTLPSLVARVEKLSAMLGRLGVTCHPATTRICHSPLVAKYKGTDEERHACWLCVDSISAFSAVGFRFCAQKQLRLTAALAYTRYVETALGTFDVKRLDFSKISRPLEFFESIGVRDWFNIDHDPDTKYIVDQTSTTMPTFHLGVLACTPADSAPVFDITVPRNSCFLAHGAVAHNCAFPSRMTIGMLMESMAGKAGMLHGHKHDATPFKYDEEHRAADVIGEELRSAGYSHFGSETLYSGVYGTELVADIFIGVVYYQRLRHMVTDKYQVRATGPVNQITRQPIKGRKVGGGIRFGEMERDSLISHGVAFMLQDRTFISSDYSEHKICEKCGNVVAIGRDDEGDVCLTCRSRAVTWISLPYVFVYLAHELAGMNIKMNLLDKSQAA